MDTKVVLRHRLTKAEMAQVKTSADGLVGFRAGSAVLTQFWTLACVWDGGTPFEYRVEIDPTETAIPDDQWLEIASWLCDRRAVTYDADGYRVEENPALQWMNSGPTSYTTADEEAKSAKRWPEFDDEGFTRADLPGAIEGIHY